MDKLAQLDKLLGKASKLSDGKAKEVATLLLSFYDETGNKTKVADCIMRFKPIVCLYFFENAVKILDPDSQLQSIHSAVCSNEVYKKNTNHAATSRGFIITAILIKNGINIARDILMRTITDAEKDGKFSNAVINKFKQYVLDYCGSIETIKVLGENTWSNHDCKNRFLRFMEAVNSSIVTVVPSAEEKDTSCVSHTPVALESTAFPAPKEKIDTVPATDVTMEIFTDLIKNLSSTSKEMSNTSKETSSVYKEMSSVCKEMSSVCKEMATLLQSLSDPNRTREDITNKDLRTTELSMELNENTRTIGDLQRKLSDSQQAIREREAHIADLSERLKNSIQMDNISQNQELITLRTNLQNSLKIEYADYLVSKESECNPDNYGALIGSLTRIFKTLRRYGITIN